MTRSMLSASRLIFALCATAVFLSACAESAGSGKKVAIPRVFVNCTTAACRRIKSPRITVIFTTSGCGQIDFGATISGSTDGIACDNVNGCYGEVTTWVDSLSDPVTKIPSGTYSICSLIDYDKDYPNQSGDTRGALDNVAVGDNTANQFITSWTDL